MKHSILARAALFACLASAAMMPAIARADDPNDPAMRNTLARAQDREMTRQLNLRQSAMVRERDSRYAAGNGAYASQSSMSAYARSHAQYEQDMAAWRHAVAACRAGDYVACGN